MENFTGQDNCLQIFKDKQFHHMEKNHKSTYFCPTCLSLMAIDRSHQIGHIDGENTFHQIFDSEYVYI
jgi:hypothetical protein